MFGSAQLFTSGVKVPWASYSYINQAHIFNIFLKTYLYLSKVQDSLKPVQNQFFSHLNSVTNALSSDFSAMGIYNFGVLGDELGNVAVTIHLQTFTEYSVCSDHNRLQSSSIWLLWSTTWGMTSPS